MNYIELYSPVKRAQIKANNDILAGLQELESNTEQREFNKTPIVLPREDNEQQNNSNGWNALIGLTSYYRPVEVQSVISGGGSGGSGPRGFRNHNWLNIRLSDNNTWQGEVVGSDNAFETFSSPEYGIRAAAKLVTNYYNSGLNTISKIINKWAPTNENDTQNYINIVASRMNIDPNKKINVKDPNVMENLLSAMTFVENGKEGDRSIIKNGIKLLNT